MTSRGFGLLLSIALVGCTSADRQPSRAGESEPAPSTSVAIDHDDPRPLLTMGSRTYGPTDYWRPEDLAEVYVYPDGSVIRVVLDGSDTADTRPLQFQLFTIDDDQLRSVIDLADAAGLTGAGTQSFLPLPDGAQVEDGGARVFTARHGDEQTSRAVDQLSEDGAFAVGDRIPFVHLLAALAPLCCQPRDDMSVQPFTRWAIVSVRNDGGNVPYPEQEWTGPDLAGLDWVDIGDDEQCAIVNRANWPLTIGERHVPVIVINGRVITRRPLLPHQQNCDDVAAVRRLLGV